MTTEFKQGQYGDCQTLAVINAYLNVRGGEKYLAGMVTEHKDKRGHIQSYEVKFPGYKRPITVTPEDLKDPKLTKSENVLIKVIEKGALRVHSNEDKVHNPFHLLAGNDDSLYRLSPQSLREPGEGLTSRLLAHSSDKPSNNSILAMGMVGHDTEVKDIHGHSFNLHGPHGYTLLCGSDGNFVVENPWDTKEKRFVLSPETASKVFGVVMVASSPTEPQTAARIKSSIDGAPKEIQAAAQSSNAFAQAYWKSSDTKGPYSLLQGNYVGEIIKKSANPYADNFADTFHEAAVALKAQFEAEEKVLVAQKSYADASAKAAPASKAETIRKVEEYAREHHLKGVVPDGVLMLGEIKAVQHELNATRKKGEQIPETGQISVAMLRAIEQFQNDSPPVGNHKTIYNPGHLKHPSKDGPGR